ncbi:uncharacterized protein LOC114175535 [Vigna unguiculata]|uniref:Uncharacterized protein n=1 Tax=Vigna unguiculata TaxID=3917 RepID=A0A4D6KV03_VIGUN|nr:uncharacterized protein LOC114175535 [Vigna unguiculata]QCD80570.1 hypothetical protein DEO72_LG2g892 [Vigna unguiculata]
MASRSVLTSSSSRSQHSHPNQPTRTCSCSPSTHPGSFRCSKHKKPPRAMSRSSPRTPNQWDPSMVAKANSLKAVLLQMLRPSTHDLHKRKSFQPRPTRFSLMNADTTAAVAVS